MLVYLILASLMGGTFAVSLICISPTSTGYFEHLFYVRWSFKYNPLYTACFSFGLLVFFLLIDKSSLYVTDINSLSVICIILNLAFVHWLYFATICHIKVFCNQICLSFLLWFWVFNSGYLFPTPRLYM